MKELSSRATESDLPPLIGRVYEVESLRELETPEPSPAESTATTDEPRDAFDPASAAQDWTRQNAERGDEPVLPFIGRILDHVPGRSITVERELTLDEDLHLADHAFVHAPGVKPLFACLPVVPMTLSLEILAETAACLAPGYGLIGFEDVKATRWIELADTDRLCLRISARFEQWDAERNTCNIAAAIHIEDQATPAIQARVLFAPYYRLDLELSFTEFANARLYPKSAEEIYRGRHLFHGPVYQCLVGEIVLGDRGAAGELVVKAPEIMFRSIRKPQFLTEPALLDAVGQLIGIWAMEKERYVFPVGIGKLELYRPTPTPGTRCPVRIEITRDEGKLLSADIEIQDGASAVWMRIRDWTDWKFRWEKRLLNFRRLPTRYLLSHALDLPALPPSASCRMISGEDIAGFDSTLLARFCLHLDEMETFSDMRSHAPGLQHWLLGRIAAKDAVRDWLARQAGTEEMLHPAALIIRNNDQGQPEVAPVPEANRLPQLSISHSEHRAIAIAHAGPVGVDIEPIRPRQPSFVETMAGESERSLLRDTSGDPDEWATRLWCAKEVAAKLLGLGMNGSPKAYEAQAIGEDGLIHIVHRDSGRTIMVRTVRLEEFVIAYAGAATAETEAGQA
ncbi:4'-phosphopantetheinyl transferase superfamily protein [Methylocaldum sp.]|jgi:phosphopantetheinyl transferase (holo-ACP synthase)|uniref:4'-phosphopantetheinyl transferase superfamily protein n=1 Tax=Methylocaldum sp. TaxID=1969727 RepID=UPI00321F82E7